MLLLFSRWLKEPVVSTPSISIAAQLVYDLHTSHRPYRSRYSRDHHGGVLPSVWRDAWAQAVRWVQDRVLLRRQVSEQVLAGAQGGVQGLRCQQVSALVAFTSALGFHYAQNSQN